MRGRGDVLRTLLHHILDQGLLRPLRYQHIDCYPWKSKRGGLEASALRPAKMLKAGHAKRKRCAP